MNEDDSPLKIAASTLAGIKMPRLRVGGPPRAERMN